MVFGRVKKPPMPPPAAEFHPADYLDADPIPGAGGYAAPLEIVHGDAGEVYAVPMEADGSAADGTIV